MRGSAPTTTYDVIILTETWLDSTIESAELGLLGYNVFRSDRSPISSSKSRGGGVLIATRKHLPVQLLDITNTNVEHLFILIKSLSCKLIVGAVYIPPASDSTIYKQHCDDIELIFSRFPNAKFLLTGDYNISDFCNLSNIHQPCSRPSSAIIDMSNLLGINQINYVRNSYNGLLDLVFSNFHNASLVPSIDSLLPIDRYHPPLFIKLSHIFNDCTSISSSSSHKDDPSYNFKRADYSKILRHLFAADWTSFYDSMDVDVQVDLFYSIVNAAIELYVPFVKVRNSVFPFWFSNDLKTMIFKKKAAHVAYKSSRSNKDYAIFSDLRRKCKVRSSGDYNRYLSDLENSISDNPKAFWRYNKSLRSNQASFPEVMTFEDVTSNSAQETLNLFANFFSSVYNADNHSSFFNYPLHSCKERLDLSGLSISAEDIDRGVRAFDLSKSAGDDGIPPSFVAECLPAICFSLFRIFNTSLNTGIFPTRWKTNFLIPLFKCDNKNEIMNYRPVCIISVIPKLFESIVYSKISNQFKWVISPLQHRFCSGRSTLTNLSIFSEYISSNLACGHQGISIYLDFRKAFDTVSHIILISKLKSLGIDGSMLS